MDACVAVHPLGANVRRLHASVRLRPLGVSGVSGVHESRRPGRITSGQCHFGDAGLWLWWFRRLSFGVTLQIIVDSSLGEGEEWRTRDPVTSAEGNFQSFCD